MKTIKVVIETVGVIVQGLLTVALATLAGMGIYIFVIKGVSCSFL